MERGVSQFEDTAEDMVSKLQPTEAPRLADVVRRLLGEEIQLGEGNPPEKAGEHQTEEGPRNPRQPVERPVDAGGQDAGGKYGNKGSRAENWGWEPC